LDEAGSDCCATTGFHNSDLEPSNSAISSKEDIVLSAVNL